CNTMRAGCFMLMPEHCFFFQAAAGIRDGHVTGVQTCALPIYLSLPLAMSSHQRRSATWKIQNDIAKGKDRCQSIPKTPVLTRPRSEERRVGKECTSKRSWRAFRKNRMI